MNVLGGTNNCSAREYRAKRVICSIGACRRNGRKCITRDAADGERRRELRQPCLAPRLQSPVVPEGSDLCMSTTRRLEPVCCSRFLQPPRRNASSVRIYMLALQRESRRNKVWPIISVCTRRRRLWPYSCRDGLSSRVIMWMLHDSAKYMLLVQNS